MNTRRPNKANHGAAQIAVVGLIGAGSAITLGRGYLAERRSKALDGELIRALKGWRLDPSVRLSPPGGTDNFSPRLRDLADPHTLTTAFDDRKRQLLAQAASGDIHVGTDRRGMLYLGLPGRPPVVVEFSRRYSKRNDASAAASAAASSAGLATAEPWAFAQYDDPVFGSWGVAIEVDGAELYRFDGATWRPSGRASWNITRGRLEHASAPEVVVNGLDRAVLASPRAKDALRAYLKTVIPTAFTGNRSDLPSLTSGADNAFRAVARARCSEVKATKSRPGTKAAEAAIAARDRDLAVAKIALRDVCGDGTKPIKPGTPCDVALDALRAAGPEMPCSIETVPCPHRVSKELFSAWRSGAFPRIGPYETDKPHAMGDDPCCYYHPMTQARLRLRREVEKTLFVPIGSAEWLKAIQAAELEAPSDLVAAWRKCDDAIARRVDALPTVTGDGVGGAGAFMLLQAFYRAAKRNDQERMSEAYASLRKEYGSLPDFETLAELDSNFWDLAIQEARDSGNLGFKRWVQMHGGKSGRTIFRRYDTARGAMW